MSMTENTSAAAVGVSPSLTPEALLNLGMSFWRAKTFLSAIELNVFTELGKKPMDEAALSGKLGLHPRSSRDFLDALVALGVLQRSGQIYSNSPDADFFLDSAKPSYIGGFLEMVNARLYTHWGSLTEGLRTGKPQNEIKAGQAEPFAELYADPVRMRGFVQAMTGLSIGTGAAIAKKFPWSKYKTFCDVGGAQGGVAVQIALQNPHLTGMVFDLPAVQPLFEEYVRSFHLENRLRFVPGNFFKEQLPNSDVILMGHILHDWGLADKKMLISKAYQALPSNGAYIAFETLIDDERKTNAMGLLMSLNMLIETPEGFDYSGADGRAWFAEAGFKDVSTEPLAGPDAMVVGFKR
jgi:hypothetical protein